MKMSTPVPRSFSERLRFARNLRNLSQADLADRAGLQGSAISHFEGGGRKPSLDNLRRLADALNVSTDFLLGRTDDVAGDVPTADAIYRHYGNLSLEDQEAAKKIVAILAGRGKGRANSGSS